MRYTDVMLRNFEGKKCQSTKYLPDISPSEEDRVVIVDSKYENRLDLVSYDMYGTTKYYWVIAQNSGIFNPLIVPVGTRLFIPDISRVRKLVGDL